MIVVIAVMVVFPITKIMLMKGEHSQEQQHQDHADGHPPYCDLYGSRARNLRQTVWDQMVQRHSENEAGDETHCRLHAGVRQANGILRLNTEQGRGDNGNGVSRQKHQRIRIHISALKNPG